MRDPPLPVATRQCDGSAAHNTRAPTAPALYAEGDTRLPTSMPRRRCRAERLWAINSARLAVAGSCVREYQILWEAQCDPSAHSLFEMVTRVASLIVRRTLFGQSFLARSALSNGVCKSISPFSISMGTSGKGPR